MGEWLTGEADRREVLTAGVAAVLVPGELGLVEEGHLDSALGEVVPARGSRWTRSNNHNVIVVAVLALRQRERERDLGGEGDRRRQEHGAGI